MKSLCKKHFTLIEIVCATVILALAFGGLLMALHASLFKVAVSNNAIQATLLAEKKLNSYRIMNWTEIPKTEEGQLDLTASEGLRYKMVSHLETNDMGGFLHISMTVSFPSEGQKDHTFEVITDIALEPGEVNSDDTILRQLDER